LVPTHPDVGTTLNNLAGLHESMGEYETAINLYEKALDIIEKEYGPDHPYFKITRNNLLGLYEKMERSWRR
jgi:tetratricopeptide (TPR) repeat protein